MLTSITTPSQSGPARNDNERVFYIVPRSRTGVSPSDAVLYYVQGSEGWSLIPLQSVYSKPN